MGDFLRRLRARELVQWAIAYIAFAFALLQGVDIVAQRFAWPGMIERLLIVALAVGFFVALVLAWYHGERGAQRVTGTELLILALLLAIGGGLLWRFARVPGATGNASVATVRSPDAAQRNPGIVAPDSAAGATTSGLRIASAPVIPIPAKSIAVLPFENLSEEKDNAYFAAGMQDEILTRLAGIRDLKVISRTSTEQYASHPPNLKTVAEQLGVATVLEGSVQRADGKVRINLQLIDARTDSHLWAQNYDRDLKDVFAVQSDVAEKVADALQAKLLPAESARIASVPTQNQRAYDLFLQAKYLFTNKLQNSSAKDPVDVGKRAAALYQGAIAADPDFALAYAWLSYLQSYLHWYNVDNSPALVDAARENAEKALALQPDLPEAHLALGYSDYWGHRDYAGALVELATARAGQPNNAEVLAAIGYVRRRQADADLGIPQMQQASLLDPKNSVYPREIAVSNAMLRRYDLSDIYYARSLAIFPGDIETQVQRVTEMLMRGDTAAGERSLAELPAEMDPQGSVSLARFHLQMLLRRPDAALTAIAHAPDWLIARFEHSLAPVALLRAQALAKKGDATAARAAFLDAEQALQTPLANPVTAADAHSYLGLVYAGLGRKQDALAAARSASDSMPMSRDIMVGAYMLERRARVEAQVGETQSALDHLEQLMRAPAGSVLSVAILRIDPVWDPLRGDPRFRALVGDGGSLSAKGKP